MRPSTARVLFFFFVFVVEEKGFEYSEYDDDSERSDFVIDDAMLFFLFFVFKPGENKERLGANRLGGDPGPTDAFELPMLFKSLLATSERGFIAESLFRESSGRSWERKDARFSLSSATFNRRRERLAGEYFVHHVYEQSGERVEESFGENDGCGCESSDYRGDVSRRRGEDFEETRGKGTRSVRENRRFYDLRQRR